jgi:hypothetical protein
MDTCRNQASLNFPRRSSSIVICLPLVLGHSLARDAAPQIKTVSADR